MGVLDDAIRDHLDLKRGRGASEQEVKRQEAEALGPVRRESGPEETPASGGIAGSEEVPAKAGAEPSAAVETEPESVPALDEPDEEADLFDQAADSAAFHHERGADRADEPGADALEPSPSRPDLQAVPPPPPATVAEPAPAVESEQGQAADEEALAEEDFMSPRELADEEEAVPESTVGEALAEEGEATPVAEAPMETGEAASDARDTDELIIEYDEELLEDEELAEEDEELAEEDEDDLLEEEGEFATRVMPAPAELDDDDEVKAVEVQALEDHEPPEEAELTEDEELAEEEKALLEEEEILEDEEFGAEPEGLAPAAPVPPADPALEEDEDDDVLEETPDFLQEAPEDERLWFEQKPPRDFDLDR